MDSGWTVAKRFGMGKGRIARKTREKKPGAQIVRAWFDTVINPLLRALETERSHLAKKDWTWQFRPGSFEVPQPIAAHLDVVPDNLEQFLQFQPEVGNVVAQHDERVGILLGTCSDLQRNLEEGAELDKLYREVTSAESLSRLRPTLLGVSEWSDENLVHSFFGAYPKPDHLALLAQYIINHTPELPYYYSTAPLWNVYRNEFLALLNYPSVKAEEEAAEKTGKDLLEAVRHLTDLLKAARETLSLEYDVPYVAAMLTTDARYL
jgi:hypothetical protein